MAQNWWQRWDRCPVPRRSRNQIWSLPKCSLQKCSLQKCSLPKCSLPKCSLPKCSLPKCSLPKCSPLQDPTRCTRFVTLPRKYQNRVEVAGKCTSLQFGSIFHHNKKCCSIAPQGQSYTTFYYGNLTPLYGDFANLCYRAMLTAVIEM